jgi:hypothetical protein
MFVKDNSSKLAVMSIAGACPNSVEEYLQDALELVKQQQASVIFCAMYTDYFTIPDKKDCLNYFFDSLRSCGITTVLMLHSGFQVQEISGITADHVEYFNYDTWRYYNEIIVKKISPTNLKWNANSDQFLFLTGKPEKQNRVRLLWKLEQAGLLDRCNWSFWYDQENLDVIGELIPEVPKDHLVTKLNSWLRNPDDIRMIQHGSSFHYPGIPYNETLFSDCRFRVISESIYTNDVPQGLTNYWISEKTYISIFNRIPWLIAEQPGCLAWLQSEGYETFDEHLIEPYDMILDGEQRLNAIVNNTRFWLQEMPNPEQINQKVEHNYHRLVEQGQESENVLKNLIKKFGISATPEQLSPTVKR